jgi:ribonucleoside-diphosphate reductase alpha chain
MSLQYGVPLEDYVRKFSHMRFEPQGYTKNPDIRIAKSLIDYIFRWLGITFLPGYKEASLGILPKEGDAVTRLEGEGDGDVDTEQRPAAAGPKKSAASKPKELKNGRTPEQKKTPSDSPFNRDAERSASPPAPTAKTNGHANGNGNGANGHAAPSALATTYSATLLARAGVMVKGAAGTVTARSELFADFQSDAPACDACGAITVRAGNCYLCHNCGSSMGCS